MSRVHRIQSHLDIRHHSATYNFTIYHDPIKNCFTERVFDASEDMKNIFSEIERQAAEDRAAKEQELKVAMEHRHQLEMEYQNLSCITTTTDRVTQLPIHERRKCPKCQLQQSLKRQTITVHEHPLPDNASQAKAVVFELRIPEGLALYRHATWRIVKNFGLGLARPRESGVIQLLRNYPPLRGYRSTEISGLAIDLASKKKSHLLSHYKEIRLPALIDDVCTANPMEYMYLDSTSRFLLQEVSNPPNFSSRVGFEIPRKSPFGLFQSDKDFDLSSNGPSSNAIISSLSKCPSSLSSHEFVSFQTLFSGSTRRWAQILLELGSTNINFSNEICSNLISALVSQVGPTDDGTSAHRRIHQQLSDHDFCEQILAQIQSRLRLIECNWRETHCMRMLIDMLLRIYALCPSSMTTKALLLLETTRSCIGDWLKALSLDMTQSTTIDATRFCSRYAL